MTDAAQIALTFCRECLNWRMPVDRRFGQQNRNPHGNPSKAWTPYVFDHDGKHGQFHYTDLNAVMAAVRARCDQHGGIAVLGFGKRKQFSAAVEVWEVDAYGEIEHDNPCHAHLTAYVEVSRELKAAK
ncbi:MAG: hypothetical protein U0840_04145 [Gemmataceae bacterium]